MTPVSHTRPPGPPDPSAEGLQIADSPERAGAAGREHARRADASAAGLAPRTLAVDCGGGGIKSSLFDRAGFQLGTAQRTAVRYPFSPADLLRIVTSHAQAFDGFERMTLGMPGMIRRGVVVYTPHYIRRAGPHTKVEPELAAAWDRLDMEEALAERFDVPALVLNDAEIAAAGVVSGRGCELVLTLGTGLGTALVDDGRLAPHLEVSHAQARWGLTYDDVVGEASASGSATPRGLGGSCARSTACGPSSGGTSSTSAAAIPRGSARACGPSSTRTSSSSRMPRA